MLETIGTELVAALAYGAIGIALMALGYILVDLATPGKLKDLIWVDRNSNAAVLLGSGLLSVGLVVVAAIVASEDDLVRGLVSTAAYGLLGLALMALAFMLLDAVTPGRLGDVLCDQRPHPAAWVSAAAHVSLGGIIAAAIL